MLNLLVAFLMDSSDALMYTASVSYLALSVPAGKGNDRCFWPIQGDVFYDPCISSPDAMNPIGDCSTGFYKPLLQNLMHTPPLIPLP